MPSRWPAVLEELLSTRRGALVGYAYVFAGDLAAAEDLVHDAVLRTFSRPRNIADVRAAEAYVRKAIATTFLNGHRRHRRFLDRVHLLARDDSEPGHDHATVQRDAIHDALDLLTPRERACAVLRFFEDLTVRDIAGTLGISEGSVKRYLSDATRTLREALGDDAPGDDEARESAPVGRRA